MIDDRDKENEVASDPPDTHGGGEAVTMDEAEVASDPPDHTDGGT